MRAALFFLVALIGLGAASLPSDEIRHVPPPEVINLQHVDPTVPKLYAAQDGNLSMFRGWELPNLGHYASRATTVTQDEPTLANSQQGMLENVPSNRTVENTTITNSTSEGLVYL